MTQDREALAAALDEQQTFQGEQWESYHSDVAQGLMDDDWCSILTDHDLINTAARERLAQLPEKCDGGCQGTGQIENSIYLGAGPAIDCYDCHGRGTVYPAETVQLIGDVLRPYGHEAAAVAVLDALNTIPAPEEAT